MYHNVVLDKSLKPASLADRCDVSLSFNSEPFLTSVIAIDILNGEGVRFDPARLAMR
jgi:hypothetical protein